MGVRNPNSTDYIHPDESNLLNIHKAMDYTESGEPALRVLSNIQGNIIIEGDVNIPGLVTVNSTPEDPVHTHVTEVGTSGILGVPYMPISGEVDIRSLPEVSVYTDSGNTLNIAGEVTQGTTPWQISKDTNANSESNRIFVNANGTVELGTTTLAALENINATVSGTVNIGTMPPVLLSNDDSTPLQVTGSVEVTQGTTPWTITGNVVVDNDSSNPLEVNAQITNVDPIEVTGNITATVTGGTFTNPDLSFTSKNRLKVSPYATVFFNTFQYGKESDIWDESTTGTASATHNSNTNAVDMYVNGVSGSKIVRQTRNVMRYIPGRTSTLTYAIRLQMPVTGIRRRFGMFQEDDGFYFEDAGVIGTDGLPEYNVVVRSSVVGGIVENRVPRSLWNGDRLDGTGDPITNPSGILADPEAQHLVNFEFEWYGAGQVTIGFVINGHSHVVHIFNHANNITLPWCSTPFLPIRLELENLNGVGGDHYLYQGSNSLITEGVAEKLGIAVNTTSPIVGTNLATKNLWYPILSIKMKSTALQGIVLPSYFQIATLDNTMVFYRLVRNCTFGTGGNGWVDHPDPNSFTQIQTFTNPSNIIDANQGVAIDSGFIASGGGGSNVRLDRDTVYQLGRTSMGTVSDTLTLLVASAITNKDAVAAMTWIEQR